MKFIEIAGKLKIDDPIEMGQLLSSVALSLGLQKEKVPQVLAQFRKDLLGDIKAGEGVQQEEKTDEYDEEMKAAGHSDKQSEELPDHLQKAILNKEENIKDHIKTKNQTLSEQLMKKWFKKGDK